MTLVSGVSTLELPVRPPDPGDDALRAFALPEVAPGPSHKPLRPLPFQRTVELDLPTNEVVYTLSSDGGEFGGHSLARLEDIGMDLGYTLTKCHRIAENDPLTAKTEIKQTVQMRRDAWRIRIASRVSLGASGEHLHFSAELHAFENDEPFESRSWNVAIPRKLF